MNTADKDSKNNLCHNCCEQPISFGVFCQRCLQGMKRDKQQREKSRAAWVAAESGAGDFWRFNH